jgi:septum formation protein
MHFENLKTDPNQDAEHGTDYVLASSSPRRKELFSSLGYPFRIVVPGYDENLTRDTDPEEHALKNAREKGLWVTRQPGAGPDAKQVVISADTIVVLDGQILNKPRDPEDSVTMLTRLSGRTHEVKTAMAIYVREAGSQTWVEEFEVVTTSVVFRPLDSGEIARYVATGEPTDKAGSYGIQGLGGIFVEKISGSYSNVVGLPLAELRRRLGAHRLLQE